MKRKDGKPKLDDGTVKTFLVKAPAGMWLTPPAVGSSKTLINLISRYGMREQFIVHHRPQIFVLKLPPLPAT